MSVVLVTMCMNLTSVFLASDQ